MSESVSQPDTQPESKTQLASEVSQENVKVSPSDKPIDSSKMGSTLPIEHWEKILVGKRMVGPNEGPDSEEASLLGLFVSVYTW